MNTLSFSLISFAVLLNTAAQLLLKAGTNALLHTDLSIHQSLRSLMIIVAEPYLRAGLICYVISFGVWVAALSKVQVSIAYPLLSMGYVINLFAAWYLFGEVLSGPKVLGVTLIIAGVCILTRG